MCTDLVIKDTHHSAFPVFTRYFDIHFTFTSLGVMGDRSRSYLIFLKIDSDPFRNTKIFKVITYSLMSLILIELAAFAFEVVRLSAISIQEAIKNLFGDLKVLTIRFRKLLQKPCCRLGIFIFKLRINFAVTFEESVITFLQILWERMV